MKGKHIYGMMAMMAAMSEVKYDENKSSGTTRNQDAIKPIVDFDNTVLPKGTNRYYFTDKGLCFEDKNPIKLGHTVDFKCVATNQKSADKKYNKFLSK